MNLCPLCQREIPPHLESKHHLTPKLKGGKHGPVAILHSVCHSKIHSLFSESELARHFSSIDSLRSHPDIAKFIRWIRKRPENFVSRNRHGGGGHGRRR